MEAEKGKVASARELVKLEEALDVARERVIVVDRTLADAREQAVLAKAYLTEKQRAYALAARALVNARDQATLAEKRLMSARRAYALLLDIGTTT